MISIRICTPRPVPPDDIHWYDARDVSLPGAKIRLDESDESDQSDGARRRKVNGREWSFHHHPGKWRAADAAWRLLSGRSAPGKVTVRIGERQLAVGRVFHLRINGD